MQAASSTRRAPALLQSPPAGPSSRLRSWRGQCKQLHAGGGAAGASAGGRPLRSPPAAAAGPSNAGHSSHAAPSSTPSDGNGTHPHAAFDWQQQWYPLVRCAAQQLCWRWLDAALFRPGSSKPPLLRCAAALQVPVSYLDRTKPLAVAVLGRQLAVWCAR